jgi:predicted transposase/invertase (TIGR01784 family)
METDSFFWQLFKQLPQTLFELIGQPGERARDYHFDSVEIKKSFRIDGLFVPRRSDLPAYFVEVQFRRSATFYANLFAKVFLYLDANPAIKDWAAVAIFESRKAEPRDLDAYEDLLNSRRVTRIYLDEYPMPAAPSLGLGVLQLVNVPTERVQAHVDHLVHEAQRREGDSEKRRRVVELVEELLLRRFAELDREEVRKMFQLHDLRRSKVWQEAHQEGIEKGREEGIEKGREEGMLLEKRNTVRRCLAKGMTVREIADLIGVDVKEVRRLARNARK